MKVESTSLEGLLVITPKRFSDQRGYFCETWQDERYGKCGVIGPFVQDNLSKSHRGVLRGLHFQNPNPQGKLVSVVDGEVFDVAVDVRLSSRTFGQWFGLNLSSDNGKQLWIPSGFAHGFFVLSEWATFSYKCTSYYSLHSEKSVRWNDPAISVAWPEGEKSVSQKDEAAPFLQDLLPQLLQFRPDNGQE